MTNEETEKFCAEQIRKNLEFMVGAPMSQETLMKAKLTIMSSMSELRNMGILPKFKVDVELDPADPSKFVVVGDLTPLFDLFK